MYMLHMSVLCAYLDIVKSDNFACVVKDHILRV